MALKDLPLELLLEIDSYLDYASGTALRLVDRNIYICLRKSTAQQAKGVPAERKYTIYDLLQIEKWPVYNSAGQQEEGHLKKPTADQDYFACNKCLRIRNAIHFTNKIIEVFGDKNGDGNILTPLRSCLDCCSELVNAWHRGCYTRFGGTMLGPGNKEKYGCGVGFLCPNCDKFQRLWSVPRTEGLTTCPQCSAAVKVHFDDQGSFRRKKVSA